MFFLQEQIVKQSTTVILNYGAVGAMLVLCILALVYISKSFIKQIEKTSLQTQEDLAMLHERLDKYIDEDRKKMIEVIEKNTIAYNNISLIINQKLN